MRKRRATFTVSSMLVVALMAGSAAMATPPDDFSWEADEYAARFGTSYVEAVRRLELQNEVVTELATVLGNEFATSVAQVAIDNGPEYRVSVYSEPGRSTPAMSRRIEQFLASAGAPSDLVVLRVAPVESMRLEALGRAASAALHSAGIRAGVGIDVPNGEVVVRTLDTAEALRAVDRLTDASLVQAVLQDPGGFETAYGNSRRQYRESNGNYTWHCMYAFPVKKGSDRGLLSAWHCENGHNDRARAMHPTVNGILEDFTVAGEDFNDDVQWDKADSASEVAAQFYNGSAVVDLLSKTWSHPIGAWVCNWGRITGADCGTVTDNRYDPSWLQTDYYVYVDGGATNVSDNGDSGMGWFSGKTAYGVHSGGSGNDGWYMPVTRAESQLGVTIFEK